MRCDLGRGRFPTPGGIPVSYDVYLIWRLLLLTRVKIFHVKPRYITAGVHLFPMKTLELLIHRLSAEGARYLWFLGVL